MVGGTGPETGRVTGWRRRRRSQDSSRPRWRTVASRNGGDQTKPGRLGRRVPETGPILRTTRRFPVVPGGYLVVHFLEFRRGGVGLGALEASSCSPGRSEDGFLVKPGPRRSPQPRLWWRRAPRRASPGRTRRDLPVATHRGIRRGAGHATRFMLSPAAETEQL